MWLTLVAALLAGLAVSVVLPPSIRVAGARRRPEPAPAAARPDRAETTPDGAAVAVLADRVAALTRAGLAPGEVWRVLAARDDETAPVCRVVARTVTLGGTSAEGLRLAGGRPGADGGPVSWLGLACAVSQSCGAPLAEVLDGVARTLRQEEDARREREAALAGPRATAAVLTWLPLAGLALAALTGTNAVAVLVTTGPGRLCLVIGGGLWWVGRRWMSWLLRRAERAGR